MASDMHAYLRDNKKLVIVFSIGMCAMILSGIMKIACAFLLKKIHNMIILKLLLRLKVRKTDVLCVWP